MDERKCPQCKSKWFSAARLETWACPNCGTALRPHEHPNENINQTSPMLDLSKEFMINKLVHE